MPNSLIILRSFGTRLTTIPLRREATNAAARFATFLRRSLIKVSAKDDLAICIPPDQCGAYRRETPAKQSAEIVSRVIVTHPMASLDHHAFGEIQNWRDTDEAIVQRLRMALTTANPLPRDVTDGIFAAHLVAAATMAGLAPGAQIPLVFQRMLDALKSMHEKNPAFGPLRVWHPGNLARDRSYVPLCAA